ncbi:MAG: lytic transglycosylase domain-containing protein, partial [Pseudomonadota bacterium]|nr:lytic transglycosylase domain-containing protein [Pseudomonadota bacterium]
MTRGAQRLFIALCAAQGIALAAVANAQEAGSRAGLHVLIDQHAKANGVPADLVHKVVRSESNYNPRAYSRGNIGLMQIRYGTARALGYAGPANGLLDANTNLTYAVRYLAGAYRAAGGNPARTIGFYRRGYYVKLRDRPRGQPATEMASTAPLLVQPVAQPAPAPSLLQRLL